MTKLLVMIHPVYYLFSLMSLLLVHCSSSENSGPAWRSEKADPFMFLHSIPVNCPFDSSRRSEITFTGQFMNYTNADTWYPSWAENDTLYSPWTDGYILRTDVYEHFIEEHPGFTCNSVDYLGRKASTAQAAIAGNDPMDLKIINLFDTMILISESLTGEWKINNYWERFGPVAYFVNIPSKFISENGGKMWLAYSANFHSKRMKGNPEGSFYSLSMHEIAVE